MIFTPEMFELCLRVVVGLLLGAGIGLERQWRSRMAGIRTNALVAGGSALFVVLGAYAFDGANADPTRVAAQVVSGIGFLGAGVIMREGLNVRGLNTAATLWCAAAIGSLAGSGLYVIAVFGALAIVGTNTLLRALGRLVNRRPGLITYGGGDQEVEYLLEAVTNDKSEARVRALMVHAVNRPEFRLHSIAARNSKNSRVTIRAELSAGAGEDASALERAVQRISLDPKIVSIRWWTEDAEEE